MPHNSEGYEILYNVLCGELTENAFEALRHNAVPKYRAKTIKSGEILECEITPFWDCRNEVRKAKAKITPEAIRNVNDRNARKWIVRLANTNFTFGDLGITLTYKGMVPTEKEARKDIRNYLRRVRDYRRKHNMSENKYIYVIEFDDGENGKRKKRIHHHIIMSGLDRDVAEKLWGKGWANSRRLQPNDYGLEAIARYIVKQPKSENSKRWASSRNLKKPLITKADTKLSKRKAERLAEDVEKAAPTIFEKLYPGYRLNDCEVKRSDFVPGAYIYVRMHRDLAHSSPKKARGKQTKPNKERVNAKEEVFQWT